MPHIGRDQDIGLRTQCDLKESCIGFVRQKASQIPWQGVGRYQFTSQAKLTNKSLHYLPTQGESRTRQDIIVFGQNSLIK